MESYVLEIKSIVKEFPGVRALDGVNLKVKKGTVHVLVGENGAGKSTLMKIISGAYIPDEGEIFYKGEKLGKRDIQATIQMGIAMIHQELSPILDMTIAENIYMGREPVLGLKSFVDFKKMYQDTQELLEKLGIHYDAHQKMRSLSIAGQQLIEIAKATSQNASVIIMDEPSSAIADAEVDMLFQQIFDLKKQGVAIIYITHKMDEIFRIADDITIIRDGKWIESGDASEYDADKLVSLMVGRTISNIFPKEDVPIGDVVLEVKNLTQKGRFENISFMLRKGEILGFSGLVGAGRSEIMRAIFGLDSIDSGEIYIEGQKVNIKNTSDAIANGVAMITEDRKAYGLVLERSIRENIALVNLSNFVKGGFIDQKSEIEQCNKMVDMLHIKIANLEMSVNNLSGGNQQKVVLAKWLIGNVKVLILDEPTRGIDVGSKSEIHKLMCSFAREGMAVIMISSELPEVLGMSDRVIVMQEGVINGEISRVEATQENIMKLATRGKENV